MSGEKAALAVVVPRDEQTAIAQRTENAPDAVLEVAQRAAKALQKVIAGKTKPVVINGETYLEFEDWQTVGRFYGYTAGSEGDPEFVELGGAQGFKATAIAIDVNGVIRSRATSFCMNDEDRWREAPKYQLASMAQTRANAKALRNVLSWVTVLAGYASTPAEEMHGVKTTPRGNGSEKPACPKCGKSTAVMVGKYPDKRTKVEKPWYCRDCKQTWGNSEQLPTAGRVGTDPEYSGPDWNPDDEPSITE